MMFVYQGVNPGQIIVSGNNTSAKKHGRRRSKGNDNVHSQNNWDNKATQKQVGDRNERYHLAGRNCSNNCNCLSR
jgi:hypothetical protein